jgi:hypothetical protein
MIKEFESIAQGILTLLNEWEPKLSALPIPIITERRNIQNRNIKQIVGHMVDSASNNTHRVVHLQYQQSPFQYPNYASFGNNDRWIAIQKYQEENWHSLVQLWKYSNIHYAYIIGHVLPEKLGNEWIAGPQQNISLKEMVVDYLRHFKLHLDEIDELINLQG